jgi:hypothetical protein
VVAVSPLARSQRQPLFRRHIRTSFRDSVHSCPIDCAYSFQQIPSGGPATTNSGKIAGTILSNDSLVWNYIEIDIAPEGSFGCSGAGGSPFATIAADIIRKLLILLRFKAGTMGECSKSGGGPLILGLMGPAEFC